MKNLKTKLEEYQSREKKGLGPLSVLLMIFVVLKLTGNIDWSWLYVLSPVWVPVCLVIIILAFMFPIVLLLAIGTKCINYITKGLKK